MDRKKKKKDDQLGVNVKRIDAGGGIVVRTKMFIDVVWWTE